jgi:hypothetical protein
MTGRSYDEIAEYYTRMTALLTEMGYEVLQPMVAKGFLKGTEKFHSFGYDNPSATNHAIKARDQWMVIQSDIVHVDLFGATEISIGCVSELAWGDILRKKTLLVMEDNNIHQHAFTYEMGMLRFKNPEDSIEYLRKFANNEI